jgi:hypothetical protein
VVKEEKKTTHYIQKKTVHLNNNYIASIYHIQLQQQKEKKRE